MNKKTIQSVFLGMVLLLMYLPILLLAVYSFMDSAIIGRSGSFTVKNYVYLSTAPDAARDAQTESGFPVDENVLPRYLPALQLNESEDWQHTTSDVIPSRHI